MIRVSSLDHCIRYFGRWEEKTDCVCTSAAYAKAYFNFSGGTVRLYVRQGPSEGVCKITLDGVVQCTAELRADEEQEICVFERTDVSGDFVHNLLLELCPGKPWTTPGTLTVLGFEAEVPVHYPHKLRREMRRELALIESGKRPTKNPAEWQPPVRRARLPLHGVRLHAGLVRDLFDMNIDNLTYNASLDWYSEGESPAWLREVSGVTEAEYTRPGWAGWAPGQIEASELGGAAGVLRWEENDALRRVSEEIVGKMKARQRTDGYYNYYPEEASFARTCFPKEAEGRELPPKYYFYQGGDPLTERKNADRSFWTRGVVEAIHAEIPNAAQVLRGMYDWFNKQDQYLCKMRYGYNATNGDVGGPMTYHTPIGRPEDIVVTERYYDQDYWMKAFAERQPMAMSHYPGERPHSTALLCVQAMADMYLATGDPKYLDAVLGCWDVYTRYYRHPGGLPTIIENDVPYPPGTYELYKRAEEACGHTNWMWINERLMQLFPTEEKYAAEIEECIYNTMMNSVQPHKSVYHILLHGKKEKGTNWNSCCQISVQIAVSSLPQYIYSFGEQEVFVNLFIPSTVEAEMTALTMETKFPYDQNVCIRVQPKTAERFTMHVRIPNWAAGDVAIKVNGAAVGTGKAGTFFALNRKWEAGDTVEFTLPVALKAIYYTGVDQVENSLPRYTFMYGPILMALKADECIDKTVVPRIPMQVDALLASVTADEKLHFAVPNTEYCIMPYMDAPDEGFTCVPIVSE